MYVFLSALLCQIQISFIDMVTSEFVLFLKYIFLEPDPA